MTGDNDLSAWIGKSRQDMDVIDPLKAGLMAATMNVDALPKGSPLPPGWHWVWFNEAVARNELGRDGHAQRGGFLPPVALPRRMWAGGRLRFHNPVKIGSRISRRSSLKSITTKTGRSGPLCFVVVGHDYLEGDVLCLSEEHELVFRQDPEPGALASEPPEPPVGATASREIIPDPVWLFRYSALTFNGHRIHYDVDYARAVEGYRGLVFHAPLLATLLMEIAAETGDAQKFKFFSFRSVSPLFDIKPFHIHAKPVDGRIIVWATTPDGRLAMSGEAGFSH